MSSMQTLNIKDIKFGRNSRIEVAGISELMNSIKQSGLLQPIGVVKKGKTYEVVYGNRRLTAVKKLGWTKIDALVHVNENQFDGDIQNLTENIQRKQVSPAEIGRYILSLEKEGLSREEISIRLGMSKNYVRSVLTAWHNIPVKFREDIDVKATNNRTKTPGKITITEANAINSAGKSFALKVHQKEVLLKAAKTNPNFKADDVYSYAAALKNGSRDPVTDATKSVKSVLSINLTEDEHNRIWDKHVTNGPFRSIQGVAMAVLRGEVSEKFKI